jgi:hypothetical protein
MEKLQSIALRDLRNNVIPPHCRNVQRPIIALLTRQGGIDRHGFHR